MSGMADYLSLPAVNASSLKRMAQSPLHYRYHADHPTPDTAAMFKGRYIHCAVLEPDEFPRHWTVWPKTRRGKEWTKFAEAAEVAGLEVLTQTEYDEALAVRDAVRAHPVAGRWLESGVAETPITWVDAETGLECKARVDWIAAADGLAVDLKTSKRIDARSFANTTHDLLYHMSAAHYLSGLRAKLGGEWRFGFIAVESSPPFDVRAGLLADDALYAGEEECRRLLRLVRDCEASGEWPGAYPDASEFDLPGWYYAQAEREAEYEIAGLAPRVHGGK